MATALRAWAEQWLSWQGAFSSHRCHPPAFRGLLALEKSRVTLTTECLMLLVQVSLGLWLVMRFGVLGAAWAILAVNAAGMVYQVVMFLANTRMNASRIGGNDGNSLVQTTSSWRTTCAMRRSPLAPPSIPFCFWRQCYLLSIGSIENFGGLGNPDRAVPEDLQFDAIAIFKAGTRAISFGLVAIGLYRCRKHPLYPPLMSLIFPLALFALWSAITSVWSPLPGYSLGHAL